MSWSLILGWLSVIPPWGSQHCGVHELGANLDVACMPLKLTNGLVEVD